MARTTGPARRTLRRQQILIVSLQIQNPTSAAALQGRATDDSFVGEPAAGLPERRQRRSRHLAAAAALDLPEEILVWEIFVRLPAKDIIRCRAVCRSWRGLTSADDFLLAHHGAQPSLPLFTLTGEAQPTFNRGHPLLGFEDNEDFELLASCDGLLLLSLSEGCFSIFNPSSRQHTLLPCLNTVGHISVVGFYLHRPSGKYRILYRKEKQKYIDLKVAYYILPVSRGRSPRRIGVPLHTPGTGKITQVSYEVTPTNLAPPVLFHSCLHWNSNRLHDDTGIAIFHTVLESFRFMQGPVGATRFCTRLCNLEDSMGFSCFDDGRTVIKIWVLEDYQREVWSSKYHIKFPVESLCSLKDTKHLVLSHKGDVLVYSCYQGYMFHCDNNGNLIEEFPCDKYSLKIIGHRFKESLVKHAFSRRRVGKKLPFFQKV